MLIFRSVRTRSMLVMALVTGLGVLPATANDGWVDGVYKPRGRGYVAGSFGKVWEYDIIINDIAATPSDEARFDFDEGQAYTGAIGAYIGYARIEFEVGYREAEFQKLQPESFGYTGEGDLNYWTFMVNSYLDIPTRIDGLSLYLGGGLGLAVMEGEIDFDVPVPVGGILNEDYRETESNFAWQLMAGLDYEFVDNVHVFGGYRFRGFGETNNESSNFIFNDHYVHGVEAGLRIDF